MVWFGLWGVVVLCCMLWYVCYELRVYVVLCVVALLCIGLWCRIVVPCLWYVVACCLQVVIASCCILC